MIVDVDINVAVGVVVDAVGSAVVAADIELVVMVACCVAVVHDRRSLCCC